jgi:hypothetical protein
MSNPMIIFAIMPHVDIQRILGYMPDFQRIFEFDE